MHSQPTLDRHLKLGSQAETADHMRIAMYSRKTWPGCEESVRNAIAALPQEDKNTRQYIAKE